MAATEGLGSQAMRLFYLHELMGGSDHEFLVNLYTRVLNRWPDEGGYRHYLSRIEGKPDLRRATVIEITQSQEAQNLGVALREETETPQPRPAATPAAAPAPTPAAPAPAAQDAGFAPAAAASADVGRVLAEIEDLRRQLVTLGADDAQDALERAEAGLRRLRAELDALHVDVCLALRQTMQDRLRGR